MPVEEFYALILRDAGFGRPGISLWHAAFFLVAIAGSLLAHRVTHVSWHRLAALAGVMGVTLVVTARVAIELLPLGLVFFQGVYAVQDVALDARLQMMISSRARATVTSVQGFVTELGAITAFLGFGAVTSVTSARTAAAAVGAMLILVAAAFAATTSASRIGRGQLDARR